MGADVFVGLRALQSIPQNLPLALRLVVEIARGLGVDRPRVVGQGVDLVVDDPELKRRRTLLQTLMLGDQPLDLRVHDRGTLFPDFVRDRRAGDFERFVRRMSGVAGEPRLVPVGPNVPAFVRGKEGSFEHLPRLFGRIRHPF